MGKPWKAQRLAACELASHSPTRLRHGLGPSHRAHSSLRRLLWIFFGAKSLQSYEPCDVFIGIQVVEVSAILWGFPKKDVAV